MSDLLFQVTESRSSKLPSKGKLSELAHGLNIDIGSSSVVTNKFKEQYTSGNEKDGYVAVLVVPGPRH